jgi:hypothetical protein
MIAEMEDDQLVHVGERIQAELRKRDLDRVEREAEEARRKLGIFLELEPGYEFKFFRVTGRNARAPTGFDPLLARFDSQRHWHLVEPDRAEGITFPIKRTRIKLACMRTTFETAGHEGPITYRQGQTTCARCYGSGKIVVSVSRPKGVEGA